MAEVRMTLEEYEALRRIISSERESEGAELADRMDSTVSAATDKPKRKASPRDRAMRIAIKEANARYRKKNGQFRAGRSQADVMRLANKLADRMMR